MIQAQPIAFMDLAREYLECQRVLHFTLDLTLARVIHHDAVLPHYARILRACHVYNVGRRWNSPVPGLSILIEDRVELAEAEPIDM